MNEATLVWSPEIARIYVLPPPLAWLEGFVHSVMGAIGSQVTFEVKTTVNPLVFKVRVRFTERISGKNMMLIWNLFQMYAAKNGSAPQGKAVEDDRTLLAEVAVRRRLGPPRNTHPVA